MPVNKNKQRGVSLIEAIIATMLFMIAFLSFMSLQVSSLETVRESFVKKTVTDTGIDFINMLHSDLYAKKKAVDKEAILQSYLNQNWQIKSNECANDVIKDCMSSTSLSDINKCPLEKIMTLKTLNTQCQLLASIPSAKMRLEECGGSANLYCLNIAWNGDKPYYADCKALDSNCIIFEVLP